MVKNKLLQIRISEELLRKLKLEAIYSGLPISQVCRLKLNDKEIRKRYINE